MFRSFLDKFISKTIFIAYLITIFTFGCGGGAFQGEPTISPGYSIEQRVEDGKRIRATVQSDPCLVDIVFGIPEEQWRCYTPIPADADRLTKQNGVESLTLQKDVSPAQEKSSGQTSGTDQINWIEADDYVGEFVTVCGPVVSAYFATSTNGQPTFLNIGKEYPDPERFTALIWGRNLSLKYPW